MASDFKERVLKIVAKIPWGKVATYGDIARLVGVKDARLVARAISGTKGLQNTISLDFAK